MNRRQVVEIDGRRGQRGKVVVVVAVVARLAALRDVCGMRRLTRQKERPNRKGGPDGGGAGGGGGCGDGFSARPTHTSISVSNSDSLLFSCPFLSFAPSLLSSFFPFLVSSTLSLSHASLSLLVVDPGSNWACPWVVAEPWREGPVCALPFNQQFSPLPPLGVGKRSVGRGPWVGVVDNAVVVVS
jgi:hypothetical protein